MAILSRFTGSHHVIETHWMNTAGAPLTRDNLLDITEVPTPTVYCPSPAISRDQVLADLEQEYGPDRTMWPVIAWEL